MTIFALHHAYEIIIKKVLKLNDNIIRVIKL